MEIVDFVIVRDLAVMDEDGFIEVTGRLKDMVIRGGENIYPSEVENFIHSHPKVEDVQVHREANDVIS